MTRYLLPLTFVISASCSDATPAVDTDAGAHGAPDSMAPPGGDLGSPAGSLFSDEPRPDDTFATVTVERTDDQGRMDIDGLDVDAEGRMFISGFVTGTAIFGPGRDDRVVSTVDAASGAHTKDLYVARYARDGTLDWVRAAPSSGFEGNGYDLAVGRARGEVFVSGAFAGTLQLPGVPALEAGCNQGQALDDNSGANGQMLLVSLDGEGALRWAVQADSRALVSGGNEVSVDAAGDVVQIGLYGTDPVAALGEGCLASAPKELTIGAARLPFDGGGFDTYVAVFDRADGGLKHLPARVGGAGRQRGKAVDAAPGLAGSAGDVVLGVDFIGPTALYATDRTESLTSLELPSGKPSQDMLVARLGYDGRYRWHLAIGSTRNDEIKGVAADPEGHVFVAGTLGGPAQLGDATLDPARVDPAATSAGFLARLHGATGELLWARVFGAEEGTAYCCELVVDGAGNALLTPTVRGNRFAFAGSSETQRFAFPEERYASTAGKGLVLRVSPTGTLLAARVLRHAAPAAQSNAGELAVRGPTVTWTGSFLGTLRLVDEHTSEDGGSRGTEYVASSAF